jgi:hypothetical protein
MHLIEMRARRKSEMQQTATAAAMDSAATSPCLALANAKWPTGAVAQAADVAALQDTAAQNERLMTAVAAILKATRR